MLHLLLLLKILILALLPMIESRDRDDYLLDRIWSLGIIPLRFHPFRGDLIVISSDPALLQSGDKMTNFGCEISFITLNKSLENDEGQFSQPRIPSIFLAIPANESSIFDIFNKFAVMQGKFNKRNSLIYYFLVWPFRIHDIDLPSLCQMLEKYSTFSTFQINSNFFIVVENQITSFRILEVYALKNKVKCVKVELEATNLLYGISHTIIRRRDNFELAEIIGTARMDKVWPDKEVEWEEKNGKICCAKGSAVSIFEDLRFALNFSISYVGGGNYTMKSLVELINNAKIDILLTQTRMSPNNGPTALHYLMPPYQDGVKAYFRQPPASTIRDIHTLPFQTPLWIAIFLMFCLVGFAFAIFSIQRVQASRIRASNEDQDRSIRVGLGIMIALGIFSSQSWDGSAFRRPGMKLISAVSWFTGILVSYLYSANIISALTLEHVPIQSFDGLLANSLEIYGEAKSGNIKQLFEGLRKVPDQKRTFTEINVSDGPQIILNDDHPAGFLQLSRYFYISIDPLNLRVQDLCGIYTVPVPNTESHYAMLVSKESPFIEIFNHKIIKMKEPGLNIRYTNHYKRSSDFVCLRNYWNTYPHFLRLKDVFTPFLILSFGLMISPFILVSEILRCRRWCWNSKIM